MRFSALPPFDTSKRIDQSLPVSTAYNTQWLSWISSQPLNPKSGYGWILSFSREEQQLVFSIDHCQFLCYVVLKIFFKEVINSTENESCLCLYFMKTIVFWVIQSDNHMSCVPENLLMCFWTCFKVLISWDNRGECPNFFYFYSTTQHVQG